MLQEMIHEGGGSQIRALYDGHHHEMIRRRDDRDASQCLDDAGLSFEAIHDDLSDAPFVDPDQQWVVFNVAHVDMPPRVTDGRNPGLRLCGVFPDAASARAHAMRLYDADPDCSVAMSTTHSWTVAASHPDQMADPTWAEDRCRELTTAHEAAVERRRRDFKRRREDPGTPECPDSVSHVTQECPDAVSPGTPDAADNGVHQQSENDIVMGVVHASTSDDGIVMGVDEQRPYTTSFPRGMEVRQQNVAVVAFMRDEVGDPAHFAFNVLACFEDEARASRWIRNVACQSIIHLDIDIVSLYEWVYPQSVGDSEAIPRTYRNPEQNRIMQFQQQQVGAVDNFRRFCASQGHDMPSIDI